MVLDRQVSGERPGGVGELMHSDVVNDRIDVRTGEPFRRLDEFLAQVGGEIVGQVFREVETDNLLAVASVRKVDEEHLVEAAFPKQLRRK